MAQPDLATFWREEHPPSLQCLVCRQPFTNQALIRTLKIRETGATEDQDQLTACSKVIETSLGQTILLFDRHWQCLLDANVHFAAVSHVWDREISQTQLRGYHVPQAPEVIKRALSAPIHVCRGFRDSNQTPDNDWEFWHDYYSVPQWTDELKGPILLVIHEIFSRAEIVIVHLDDVGPDTVRKLLEGTTTAERLQGITGICNAKWFGRIWTAMELVRSNSIRTMISDGTFVDSSCEPVFLGKLTEVWDDEVRKRHCVYCVEEEAKMGENMVPWNLGPLRQVKKRKRTNFAEAFALLSLRGGRDRMDFLHAFRGIVVGGTSRPLADEFWEEFVQTARDCLMVDDYSPLLITPVIPMETHHIHHGYNNIFRWELGEETSPPALQKAVSIDEATGQVLVKLESIGTVVEAVQQTGGGAPDLGFDEDISQCLTLTLKHLGPDLLKFVDSVGARLFGEDMNFIMSHLAEKGNLETVQSVLEERHQLLDTQPWPVEGEHGINWMMEALSLSFAVQGRPESRIALIRARYGTMHCGQWHQTLSITCETCQQTFLFRAGGYVLEGDLLGARAFRIPGLKYEMSLPNGMGLLEKEGRIVGRMLWATPACPCLVKEDVKLRLPKYIAPHPHSE